MARLGFALAALLVMSGGCKRRDKDDGTGGGGGAGGQGASGGVGAASSGGGGSGGGGGDGGAPPTWSLLGTGTSADLHALWQASAGAAVYAVGDGGVVLRSDDDGASFTTLTSGTTANLRGVWAEGAQVFAVGEAGTLIRSTNGGDDFEVVDIGQTVLLDEIWGASASQLYIGGDGGRILRSTDGGDTWDNLPNGGLTTVHGVYGASSELLFASAEAAIFWSEDGGDTWDSLSVSLNPQLDVWGTSPTDILTVNTVSVITYWDGSVIHKLLITPQRELSGVWQGADSRLYVSGQAGTILSADGPLEDWSEEDTNTSVYLYDVHGAAELFACGADGVVVRRD